MINYRNSLCCKDQKTVGREMGRIGGKRYGCWHNIYIIVV